MQNTNCQSSDFIGFSIRYQLSFRNNLGHILQVIHNAYMMNIYLLILNEVLTNFSKN